MQFAQPNQLTIEQQKGLDILHSGENVFLTGGAGSGKSFLIKKYTYQINTKETPVLASTGAAAVLIGGRTFHSFFGIGILEGGPKATFERVCLDSRVISRLRKVEGFILDEISMIPGETLAVAESLARFARNSNLPWGGMRVIAVGDFAQLPPVTKTAQRDWSFTHDVWHKTGFSVVELHHNQRVDDDHFLKILGKIRIGHVDKEVMEFLNSKICVHNDEDESIRLFPRREQADQLNNKKLEQIQKPSFTSHSLFLGSAKHIEILKKNSPLPDCLTLKEGCQVMLLQNDPAYRWVNGTRGTVVEIAPDKIRIEKSRGRLIEVEKVQFGLQDAEGNTLASVINFPLRLAYATTIHKSQGATLDNLWVDLRRLWEPGHAYVALSRLSQPSGLKLLGWNSKSISVDPQVLKFYSDLKLNREDPTSPEL